MRLRAPRSNMKKRYSKKRGPVTSKKAAADGITFASNLEKYMYLALKKAKIHALYEGETFELVESFDFPFECFERQSNGKGELQNRGNKKVLNIKYTPDFIGKNFIIEVKGRANESFPMRWKLFKKYIADHKLAPFTLYKPQNQSECDRVVELILERQKQTPGSNT
jgi:hypothetical protein